MTTVSRPPRTASTARLAKLIPTPVAIPLIMLPASPAIIPLEAGAGAGAAAGAAAATGAGAGAAGRAATGAGAAAGRAATGAGDLAEDRRTIQIADHTNFPASPAYVFSVKLVSPDDVS